MFFIMVLYTTFMLIYQLNNMSLRIPSNQIINKYAVEGKYMFKETQLGYTGYYYEWKGKKYAGEKFNISNPEIIEINPSNLNNLLQKESTYMYGVISKVNLNPISISTFYFDKDTMDNQYRYFTLIKNKNLIKEINKETFEQIKNNPLYSSVSIFYKNGFDDNELERANKVIPGLKTFLNSGYVPGISD